MKKQLIEVSESKNQVLINILQIISESERWYSLKEIADLISVSDRSSQRYINELYDVVIAYNKKNENSFSLITKKNYGVKLLVSSHVSVECLVNYILQGDENIKLLIALSFEEYENITDYSEKNFIAKYSVNQICHKCNDILKYFSLKIDKKNFKFNGSERNIRGFIYHFSWSLYNYEEWPKHFQFINYHEIESDVLYIAEALSISIKNPIKLKKIMYCLTIFLMRYNKNKTIALSNKLKKYIPIYINESDNPVLTDIVNHVFEKRFVYNRDEVNSFILYLLCGGGIYRSPYLRNNILEYHHRIKSDVFEATFLFFDIFQKNVSAISVEDFEASFEFIFRSHLKVSIYLELQIEFEQSYSLGEISESYENYLNKIIELINQMKETKDLKIFEDKTYLSQRYIMLLLSLNLQKNYNKPIYIKLNTDYPSIYEEYLKKYISDYFKYDYNLKFIDNSYFQKPDLILNTLPELDKHNQEVISIACPICERELEKLQVNLDNLIRQYI